MGYAERAPYESSVDWANLEKKELYIRDRTLSSMVEHSDFVDAIFHTWLHKEPSESEKKMLHSVLVSFCGGWSIIPPVVFAARLAATTKAPVAQCLAAGFSASGPAHTSAIEEIMKAYLSVAEDGMEGYVRGELAAGRKIPGFGHPVLDRDPRPPILHSKCRALKVDGEAVRRYETAERVLREEKGIHPNVDGINGAILIDLGFRNPAYGPALFLMGRSLSMTAHIIEEMGNRPFRALDLVYPGFEQVKYGHGPEE